MANRKKKPDSEKTEEKVNKSQNTPENDNLSMSDKLKAAAGSLSKANADQRARNSELAKRRAKSEKATAARIAEAEKRKAENEKAAQKVAEEKLAAFDYAQNYRKKLLKERETAMSLAKQRDAEAREAAAQQAKEVSDRNLASQLETERREAQARSERAESVVNSVTKREAVDDGDKVLDDRLSEEKQNVAPDADAAAVEIDNTSIADAATEAAPESEETPAEKSTAESDDAPGVEEVSDDVPEATSDSGAENAENIEAEDSAIEDSELDTDIEADEEGQEDESDDVITVTYDEDDGEAHKIDDDFEMTFDENGNLIINRSKPKEPENEEPDNLGKKPKKKGVYRDIPEVTDREVKEFKDKYNKLYEERRKEKQRAKGIDPDAEKISSADDVLLQEEIISVIKAEGKRLSGSELALRMYIKHSEEALKSFEKALHEAERSLENNQNEAEGPAIIVSVLKICGKILEIKCDNLANFARLKAYKYIRNARIALHGEVNRYNEYVIAYAAMTGEQLTRLSTLLPDSVASGKSLAIVPDLSYKESYVEVYPDEDGNLPSESTETLIQVTAPRTGEELIGKIEIPKSKFACNSYTRKIKRTIDKLDDDSKRLSLLIRDTKIYKKRYENELRSLDVKTSPEERSKSKYKNKVINISIKYGKKLSGIKTSKTRSAFSRTRKRLYITRLAVEKEKLKLAYNYLIEVHRAGKYTQRKAAEDFFVKAMVTYNKCAEGCTKVTGTPFYTLPISIVERVCAGEKELKLPVVAYKRELIETVGTTRRLISTVVQSDIAPDEENYIERSREVLEHTGTFTGSNLLIDESPMTDRASAIASVMISALHDGAEVVRTADDFDDFTKKCDRAIKYFKKSLKGTEKAISNAFDDDGVIIALVENLRVASNLIEVRRLCIEVSMRMQRTDVAKHHSRALYKDIELYNGRAIDYMSIVGEQFSRISTANPKDLLDMASKIKVPEITYKDTYIEVFPRDPLKDMTFEKPYQHNRKERTGYTPLLMKHFRLTENRAVEMSLVNAPYVFDVTVNEDPVVSWWHPTTLIGKLFVWFQPVITLFKRLFANAEFTFIDAGTVYDKGKVERKKIRVEKKRERLEKKLDKLNRKHKEKILALETVIHDSDRSTQAYHKKLYKINSKYNRKIYRLKLRWSEECTGLTRTRFMLEKLVLERERLTGMNRIIVKYRSYGRLTFLPNILVRFKKKFLRLINEHNKTAEELSKLLEVPISIVSTTVVEEVIRYGNTIKFPQIICCREIIETIDKTKRTIGDKWHGYGLYTGTSGANGAPGGKSPVMSVGAMGYATDMGVPFLKADFDGMTMLGMTPGGVPLIGLGKSNEAAIPFTGTPMMLQGTDDSAVLEAGINSTNNPVLGAAQTSNPYSGIHSAGVDVIYAEEYEDSVKDLNSGSTSETPLDLEAKMIEERFSRSLRARSMTMVDGGAVTWWKLVFSEINIRWMRKLFLRERGFLRFLLPREDAFTERVNGMVSERDKIELNNIAKLGALIDIECQRLYSATKVGIRRSQRVWSRWLHDDIEKYNAMVHEFNTRSSPERNAKLGDRPGESRLRNEWIEPLSMAIPDRIVFRMDDRPPTPRVLSLRNKVEIDETSRPITAGGLYRALIRYATETGFAPFTAIFSGINAFFNKNNENGENGRMLIDLRGAAMWCASSNIAIKASSWSHRRFNNETRHFRIRQEKTRAIRRFNKRSARTIGAANDPIKYQKKAFKSLRTYVSTIFRVDYNIRIRQLIYRSLRLDFDVYWIVTFAFCAVMALMSLFVVPPPITQVLLILALSWVVLPIVLFVAKIIYKIVEFLVCLCFILPQYSWFVEYGTRDVERNRYGIMLQAFTAEQYKVLSAAERLYRHPKKKKCRRHLLKKVNHYNKIIDKYSKALRIPIAPIEPTALIEKLTSGDPEREITELQNFIYVRELVERSNEHEIDDVARKRDLDNLLASLQGELNEIITQINAQNPVGSADVTFLQVSVQKLINYINTGETPSEHERFKLKRDLIGAINRFDLTANQIDLFSRDVIKLVDSLGKKPKRKIISVLATDDMIDLKTKNNKK